MLGSLRSIIFLFLSFLILGGQMNGQVVNKILKPNHKDGKDALLAIISPTKNYGATELFNLKSWTMGGAPTVTRTVIDFSLGCIPDIGELKSAEIRLFYTQDDLFPQFVKPSGETRIEVFRVIQSWEENKVNWGNQPKVTRRNMITMEGVSSDTTTLIIDVTDLVEDYLRDRKNSFGFLMKLENETPYSYIGFASSDHPDPSKHPEIRIEYEMPVEGCVELSPENGCVYDSEVSELFPCGNFGSKPILELVNADSNERKKIFLGLDLSWFSESNKVNSSIMVMEGPENKSDGGVIVQRVTENWEEHRITWENQPRQKESSQILVNTDKEIEITRLINPPDGFFGVSLEKISGEFPELYFGSDYEDSDKWPKMEVCFSPKPVVISEQELGYFIRTSSNPNRKAIELKISAGAIKKFRIYNLKWELVRTFEDVFYTQEWFDLKGLPFGAYYGVVDLVGYEIGGFSFVFED